MNNPARTDELDLIRQCVNGDRDRYAVLVDRYKNMVYTIAYRMLGDGEAAKDVAQDSFLSAYLGLPTFRHRSRFSTWLCSIVMNKCRDHRRARKESISVDDVAEIRADEDTLPDVDCSARETRDLVQQALNALPDEYREVLVLKHIEEFDYREIADILGDGLGALKVRAHRGREMLRKMLEQAGVTHG
jgi:RNA polymerase sigma-70 factor (ECF subfamily)